eukprot:CAMPEP_0205952246 /NCGR_PEP_ID=MMETSP1459-20131121/5454_1 /ASSEMBLY_ACC=CAM_ASM_001120 /TAXON_ID=41880 /ORGANISM="Pycnococcus provasolii, Strain RCC931" /LENGTH=509 /DNA_ID=CAMNT_0053324171 /DNA_START=32 /DNA_END=1558 /DNA_ORIENTATION=-
MSAPSPAPSPKHNNKEPVVNDPHLDHVGGLSCPPLTLTLTLGKPGLVPKGGLELEGGLKGKKKHSAKAPGGDGEVKKDVKNDFGAHAADAGFHEAGAAARNDDESEPGPSEEEQEADLLMLLTQDGDKHDQQQQQQHSFRSRHHTRKRVTSTNVAFRKHATPDGAANAGAAAAAAVAAAGAVADTSLLHQTHPSTSMNKAKSTKKQTSKTPTTSSTLGYRGVSYAKHHKKYMAYVNHLKRQIHLGCYATPLEAAYVRDRAWKDLNKDPDMLNFAVDSAVPEEFAASVEQVRSIIKTTRATAEQRSAKKSVRAKKPKSKLPSSDQQLQQLAHVAAGAAGSALGVGPIITKKRSAGRRPIKVPKRMIDDIANGHEYENALTTAVEKNLRQYDQNMEDVNGVDVVTTHGNAHIPIATAGVNAVSASAAAGAGAGAGAISAPRFHAVDAIPRVPPPMPSDNFHLPPPSPPPPSARGGGDDDDDDNNNNNNNDDDDDDNARKSMLAEFRNTENW